MKKSYLISILLTIIILGIYISSPMKETIHTNSIYQVYLKGNKIGLINDEEKLYDLINKEQKSIKDKFGVDRVYPPEDFNIVKINTYENKVITEKEIYNIIEKNDDFAIKGYTVSIKSQNNDVEDIKLNVLNKEIFDESIDKFIKAFIDEDLYNDYINNEQEEIVDTGSTIEAMNFLENISIKESYISVKDEIFMNSIELTQYLLFGKNAKIDKYVIKSGDTISTISNENKLNTSEFLIANPEYRDENTMLEIGKTVNVTLVNPSLNFVYKVKDITEVEVEFSNFNEVDNTKPSSYSEIKIAGVPGLEVVSKEYNVINGLASQEVELTVEKVIREKVDQVTVKGPTYYGGSSSTSSGFIETGLSFTWATNPGAIITSPFGVWRQGEKHTGTDYSGTGANSPIYAIADGVVSQVVVYCGYNKCSRWTGGNYIVINHGNNYYSTYLHLYQNSMKVKVGQSVSKGQHIAGMGTTGWSTGTHLHLGFSVGEPYSGVSVVYYNPHRLILGY